MAMGGERSLLSFEGNIAAGKTTLGRRMADSGRFGFIEEPVGAWQTGFDQNLLDLFYRDAHRWAFSFQLAAFVTRAKTWAERLSQADDPVVVLERSIYCDRYVFAKNCYQSGLMTRTEWQLYCRTWDLLQSTWSVELDRILYLRTPADICRARIAQRGRAEESVVPLEYLRDLEVLHDEWLIDHPRAVVLDGRQAWTAEAVSRELAAAGVCFEGAPAPCSGS
jgi:deoxyadenosine/deoxycytidine kinase